MKSSDTQMELVRRYLGGEATLEEARRLESMLAVDAQLRRDYLAYARIEAGLSSKVRPQLVKTTPRRSVWLSWRPIAAAAAVVALTLIITEVVHARLAERREMASVVSASGVGEYFGANGSLRETLGVGMKLAAGDSVETRSCDAVFELKLRDGGKLTLGANGSLRILDGESGKNSRWNLLRGALWVNAAAQGISVQTPNAAIDSHDAQFEVQTGAEGTLLKVSEGSARLRSLLDGRQVNVAAGMQLGLGMSRDEPLRVVAQPEPMTRWTCHFTPEVPPAFGKWGRVDKESAVRLAAVPILWPLPQRDPVLIHLASFRVLNDSPQPVLVRDNSTLIVRGRIKRPHAVHLGFSAKQLRGGYAGMFEIDLPPEKDGEWEVRLPVSRFRPKSPSQVPSPDGLEIVDVYAFTTLEDAGLELTHIELGHE